MPLDPQAQDFLDKAAILRTLKLADMPLDQVRALAIPIPGEPVTIGRREDRCVPGPTDGVEIPVRVYWPEGSADSSAGYPAIVYYHGGGWVMGTLDVYDSLCHQLVRAGNCVVISVDYRLAPEHPFPAAAEDSHAATVWVAENAQELGVDPQRLVVAGDSAGGNLAAVVALMARDRASVAIAHQVLIYPITDSSTETQSYQDNAEGYFLTRESMLWFWEQYTPNSTDRTNPYVSPLRAESLAGLPPAYVLTAEYDPLRDEGEVYAERLAQSGVPVELQRFDGLIHGFLRRTDIYHQSNTVVDRIGQIVRATPSGNRDEMNPGTGGE